MNKIKELQENIGYWEGVKRDTEVAINQQKRRLERVEKEIQRNRAKLEELSPLPAKGQLWCHNKTGRTYLVVCIGVKNPMSGKGNLRLVRLDNGNRWTNIKDYDDPFSGSIEGEGCEAFTYLGMAHAHLYVDGAPIRL